MYAIYFIFFACTSWCLVVSFDCLLDRHRCVCWLQYAQHRVWKSLVGIPPNWRLHRVCLCRHGCILTLVDFLFSIWKNESLTRFCFLQWESSDLEYFSIFRILKYQFLACRFLKWLKEIFNFLIWNIDCFILTHTRALIIHFLYIKPVFGYHFLCTKIKMHANSYDDLFRLVTKKRIQVWIWKS